MRLLEDDETYLRAKDFNWEFIPGSNPASEGGYLIIKQFPVNQTLYSESVIDLMIRIPAGYNQARLDMFYVTPHLKLKGTTDYPQAAANFETHVNRNWQRFSRHLVDGAWRPGLDGLDSFMSLVIKELQGRK